MIKQFGGGPIPPIPVHLTAVGNALFFFLGDAAYNAETSGERRN